MILCKLYHIEDALYTFGYRGEKTKKIHLTEDEEKIIMAYRANKDMHSAIKRLLNL